MTLVRPVSAMTWELRGAWASGKRVALTLDERCVISRVEGWVEKVAATGAFVVVNGWHIPLDAVLALHSPSRLGDSTAKNGKWRGPPRFVAPQEEALWVNDREVA